LAFFTFNADGSQVHCDILSAGTSPTSSSSTSSTSYNINHHASATVSSDHSNSTTDNSNIDIRNVKHSNINRINKSQGKSTQSRNAVIVVEKGQYHALTAAPASLGYAGYSVVFESSGRVFDPSVSTKVSSVIIISMMTILSMYIH